MSEIMWQRTAVKGDVRRKYGAVHDTIFVYTKTEHYTFQSVYRATDEAYRARFKYDDNDGRGPYQSAPLDSPNPRPNLTYTYKGYPPPGNGWRVSLEVMQQLDAEGRLIFPKTSSGRLRRKVYLREQSGPKATDVWTDIPPLQAASAERLGYPTQKPLALLERIVSVSSNEGDIVLDPFCGCGTAVAAAHNLNRRWIGINITHLAIALQTNRLYDMFGIKSREDYAVVGQPEDLAGARYLATADKTAGRYQFQDWANSLVQAQPRGGVLGKSKRGKDEGIDGIITFIDEANGGRAKRVIVQIKSGKVSSRDVRDLTGVVDRESATIGLFITLEPPTRDMIAEVARAGFYHSPGWGKDYPRIQILTIEELLTGKQPEMPPQRTTFKQAPRADYSSNDQPPLL